MDSKNIVKTSNMIFILYLFCCLLGTALTEDEDVLFRRDHNFTELVKFDGFESETHYVITKDGYNLTMYRLKAQNCSGNENYDPMVLMHPLFLSSDSWILPGPNRSHGYIYSRKCRDVWLPNSRGTFYSRRHVSLDPDKDTKFWNFTFVDMARNDMPACIDYVLNNTGKEQIVYVGHGQSVPLLLLLCAEQPEYNAKIKAAFGMSTTVWMNHTRFIIMQLNGYLSSILTVPIEAGLNGEFVPRGGPYQPILKSLCGTFPESYKTCSALYFALLGYNNYQIANDTLREMTGHIPSGTSLKNFNYWGNIIRNGFTMYDYGTLGNIQAYGQVKPPEYDLSNVTVKWFFYVSKGDIVSVETDVDILISKLKNATKCVLSNVLFGHLDFFYGKDLVNLITPSILKYLEYEIFDCL